MKPIMMTLAMVLLSGCATVDLSLTRPAVEHVVLFWLKEPGNEEHRRKIIEASRTFEQIPTVLSVKVGAPVPSERDIVDDSFDVGLIVTVLDRDGLQAYLDHPIHVEAKNGVLLPLVDKVLVYDIEP